MLLDFESFVELLRGLPIAFWVFISVIFLSSHVGPVNSVHDFTAYRMQHFDLHGTHYGSRSAVVNMEVRGEAAATLNRKCVVLHWAELTLQRFLDLVHRGTGAMVLLVPPDISGEQDDEVKAWRELENELLATEVPIPVYLAVENEGLEKVYQETTATAELERNTSVAGTLLSILAGYGYHMVSDQVKETEPMKDPKVVTLVGKLVGQGMEHNLPTVALVSHYDAFGLATSLSYGFDSNGSGAAALLELARIFARLYNDPKQKPKYNLLFVLTGGGKLNYFGTEAFLSEEMDDRDSSLLPNADYSLCLDSLASRSQLYLHVSRPPSEGSRAYSLINSLNQTREYTWCKKKVRLSGENLAWEHEVFSLRQRRLAAGTLSTVQNHKDLRRKSMFVDKCDVDVLTQNVKVIAEGLARHIYNISDLESDDPAEVFAGSLTVRADYLSSWLELLSLHPRSPQLLTKTHPVVMALEQGLGRYLQEVTVLTHSPDKSDPEFVVYDVQSTTMHAYKIKPAIFDLFLALFIVIYIVIWYLAVAYFYRFMPYVESFSTVIKVKAE